MVFDVGAFGMVKAVSLVVCWVDIAGIVEPAAFCAASVVGSASIAAAASAAARLWRLRRRPSLRRVGPMRVRVTQRR